MDTTFRSATRRNLMFFAIVGYLVDVLVACVVLKVFFEENDPWIMGLLLPLAIYLVVAVYSAYVTLKRWVCFILFEREDRIKLLLTEFHEMKMPRPDGEYADAEDYLTKAALFGDLPDKSRFFAGVVVGTGNGSKLFDRILSSIVLESAIKRYRPQGDTQQG